jgi:hypothetical protein
MCQPVVYVTTVHPPVAWEQTGGWECNNVTVRGDLMTGFLLLSFPAKIHVPADIPVSQCYWFDHEQRHETDFLIHALIAFVGEWYRVRSDLQFSTKLH